MNIISHPQTVPTSPHSDAKARAEAQLRFFVLVTDEGAQILSKLMQRHRLVDVARRS
ncbi:hypothetical protein [Rhizobium leguminosarum]|uniref:hypothetical protein n=1 Tax=Rhizobium leguminosarum TaxID=384 RepID=UPI0013F16AFE|nr:hypothetical protein [Rhizobium leguminosarum]